MLLPALGVECEEGEQVDGSLEHIEPAAGSVPVEAVSGVTPLRVGAEGLAHIIGAPPVGVTGSAVLIPSDEHGVVILGVLVDQPRPDEGGEHLPINKTLLKQVCVDPAHLPVGRGLDKFFR